jgi:16S rRNA (guanine966-N2)-methyltransferase
MKLTGGNWNGRLINAPEGMVTRPTSDLVRGAIFNTLQFMIDAYKDTVVLDAFAGSGALGLEALSRGAHHAVLVESDQRAFDVLQRNVAMLDCKKRVTLKRIDILALSFTQRAYDPFNLVFLDPPYEYSAELVAKVLSHLVNSRVLAKKAFVVYEHSPAQTLELPKGFEQLKEKEYGSTLVTYLQYKGA